MRIRNPKFAFIVLLFCGLVNCYSQTELKKVKFELYFDKNEPITAGNLIVKDSNPIIGTQSDINGKAELNLQNWNVTIELNYIGPYIKFDIKENTDLIKINIKRRKIIYYKGNKVLKREKLILYGD